MLRFGRGGTARCGMSRKGGKKRNCREYLERWSKPRACAGTGRRAVTAKPFGIKSLALPRSLHTVSPVVGPPGGEGHPGDSAGEHANAEQDDEVRAAGPGHAPQREPCPGECGAAAPHRKPCPDAERLRLPCRCPGRLPAHPPAPADVPQGE